MSKSSYGEERAQALIVMQEACDLLQRLDKRHHFKPHTRMHIKNTLYRFNLLKELEREDEEEEEEEGGPRDASTDHPTH